MKQTAIWIVAGILIASCSTETYEFDQNDGQRVQASFTSKIATRVVNNLWEEGDEVGIFMSKHGEELSDETLVDFSFNRKYLASPDGHLSPASELDKLYYPQIGSVNFVAYYPFANVEDYQVKLDVSNQSDLAAIDFIYSNNLSDIGVSSESQNLVFDHQLSKVVFEFSLAEDMTDVSLDGALLTFSNVVDKGTFDLATGTLVSGTSVRDIVANLSVSASLKVEAIMIPQPCDEVEVLLVLPSGHSYRYDFEEAHEWVSGSQYTYNVTLADNSETSVTLEAEITNWTENDASNSMQESIAQPWDGLTARTLWYSADKTEMEIVYAEDLAGLAQLVNSGVTFEGKTIRLVNHLDMNSQAWIPIGTLDNPFKGTFDGNNHRIFHLNPESGTIRYVGLFGLSEGTIKSLIVEGDYDAVIAETEGATTYIFNVGGVCGLSKGSISDCRNYAHVKGTISLNVDVQTNPYVGGIAGQNLGVIENCQNYGIIETVNTNSGENAYIHLGGIAGVNTGKIANCDNTRNLIANGSKVRAGGVAGLSSGNAASIESCSNLGNINVPVSYNEVSIGGTVGKNASGSTISSVVNKGHLNIVLTAGKTVMGGGVVGLNDAAVVTEGMNHGTVTVEGCGEEDMAVAGGVVGYNMNTGAIHHGMNYASVTALGAVDNYSGGIVGYNNLKISGDKDVAGYVYDCCRNQGNPVKWIGNASGSNSLITSCEEEHN